MSRKSGKPPQQPLSERDRRELLDELGSVQDMLRDQDSGGGDAEEEPPVLKPEDGGDSTRGDTDQQMPLLQPEESGEDGRDEANERLRQALRERPNPFLSDAARKTSPGEEPPVAENSGTETPQGPSKSGTAQSQAAGAGSADASALTEEQMRALVDEVLAAWLPKIERELRDRLMERLRNQQG